MDMFTSTLLNTPAYLSTSVQPHTVAFSLVNVFEVFYRISRYVAPPCGHSENKQFLRFVVSIWLETRVPPKGRRTSGLHNLSLKT